MDFSTLIDFFSAYAGVLQSPLGIILTTFVFGEFAFVTHFFIASNDPQSFIGIVVYATVGYLLADMFWFTVGRNTFLKKYIQNIIKKVSNDQHKKIEIFVHKNIFYVTSMMKFFSGLRLIIILTISSLKISYSKFLLADSIGAVLYITILGYMTVRIGEQVIEYLYYSKNILTSIIIVCILVLTFVHRKKILNKVL